MRAIKLLLATFLLTNLNLYAGNYYFKFNLGIGTEDVEKVLIYYQITEYSGKKSQPIPFSINDVNNIEQLRLRLKKSEIKYITFEGYAIDKYKNEKPILRLRSDLNNINSGKNNPTTLTIITVTPENRRPKPITEFLSELERKTYLKILDRSDDSINYNNFFPLGKFILYDPADKKNNIDVITITSPNSEYVQSSKSIKDHYILKKKAGANLDVKYGKIADASFKRDKQQYIEYLVEIKKMKILQWQSDKSEAEHLYERYENNNLGVISQPMLRNPNYRLLFISSCVKIEDFKIMSAIHDSIATITDVNVGIPRTSRNPLLTVNAGVIYSRDELAFTQDSTEIFFTGFRVRDYTDYVKGLISDIDRSEKIRLAREKVQTHETNVMSLFNDLREIDPSLVKFNSVAVIARFFENINSREPLEFNPEKETEINVANKKIHAYNVTLEILKEEITKYKNAKNYLDDLQSSSDNNSNFRASNLPKEIKIDDKIVETLAKKSPE